MLTFMGFHLPLDGYGYGTIQIAKELQRNDRRVRVLDMRANDGFGTAGDREWHVPGTVVALCTPDWLPYIHGDELISYTMFEASGLPKGWADLINANADRVMVPCEWCRQVFVDNGVRKPIDVVKWGVAPEDYWPLQRSTPLHDLPASWLSDGERPYRFLWSGTPDLRKGWDVAYRAFMAAFGKRTDVELVLHFRGDLPGRVKFSDKNVRTVVGLFDRPLLRMMLQEVDCFVFPSRGEGWGSPPREAAATGLPVIATNYGGLAEEIDQWAMPLRVSGFSAAEYGWWDAGTIGQWPEPDTNHLVELMRYCVEHRAEMARFGLKAAEWLRCEGTWARTARDLLKSVEQREVMA
ncbi:hypothetical protein TFLX_03146 [Thermoflexales bacterium]|nr:hypothetical protein TFLX_03146 [Thermoflexales bacterium]